MRKGNRIYIFLYWVRFSDFERERRRRVQGFEDGDAGLQLLCGGGLKREREREREYDGVCGKLEELVNGVVS